MKDILNVEANSMSSAESRAAASSRYFSFFAMFLHFPMISPVRR